MNTRSLLISFCCVTLAVTLIGLRLFPSRTNTVFIVEPIDFWVFDQIIFKSFSKRKTAVMRDALLPKFTRPCREAFERAGLRSPSQMAWESGIVIQYFGDLYDMEAEELGLMYNETRDSYKWEFGTGLAQAGTVPHVLYGVVLTTDGRPHIFIHDSAFFGESFWLGTSSLSDVLTHELIHAGGQPPIPGWFGPFQHDLAGFEQYDEIIEACR